MIIEETKQSILKRKWLSLIMVVQITISLVLVIISIGEYSTSKYLQEVFNQTFNSQNFYSVSPGFLPTSLDDSGTTDQPLDEKYIPNVKKLRQLLNETQRLQFIELITHQPIQIKDFKGGLQFELNYERGAQPEKIDIDKDGIPYTNVKSAQMGISCIKAFNLKVSDGRMFEESDMHYKKGSDIPVLLGDEYKGTYNIGDTVSVWHLSNFMQAKVIGFLEKDSAVINNITSGSKVCYLDRYFVLPTVIMDDVPQSEDDLGIQISNLYNTIQGYVKTDMEIDQVNNILSDLSYKAGAPECRVIDIEKLEVMGVQGDIFIKLLFSAAVLIGIFACIGLSMSILNKIELNINTYSVHMICGGTTRDIKKYIIFEVMTILAISDFIAILIGLIAKVQFTDPYVWAAMLGINLAMLLITTIIPIIKISKLKISEMLRRKD